MKSSGESTLPWGTPCFGCTWRLSRPSSRVLTNRFWRKVWRILNKGPRIPAIQSLNSKPLCQTLSNAFSRSRFIRAAFNLLFFIISNSIFNRKSDLVVFLFCMNPSCSWSIRLFSNMNVFSRLFSILSKIFPM